MVMEKSGKPIANSSEVRESLVEALKLDLVGPWPDHDLSEEQLPGYANRGRWTTSKNSRLEQCAARGARVSANHEINRYPKYA